MLGNGGSTRKRGRQRARWLDDINVVTNCTLTKLCDSAIGRNACRKMVMVGLITCRSRRRLDPLFHPSPGNITQALLQPRESLPPGSSEAWPAWSSLNRFRTGNGRCKSLMQKWGFNEDGQTSANVHVDEQTLKHLLVCHILPQPCTHEDLGEFNPRARSSQAVRESGRPYSYSRRRSRFVCSGYCSNNMSSSARGVNVHIWHRQFILNGCNKKIILLVQWVIVRMEIYVHSTPDRRVIHLFSECRYRHLPEESDLFFRSTNFSHPAMYRTLNIQGSHCGHHMYGLR